MRVVVQIVFELLVFICRTRNLHDFRKSKSTESAKFEMVTTQKLFELQPYGLICGVISTCGLIVKKIFNSKI